MKLTPIDITPGSGEKVWWQCKKGHEWEAVIGSRNKGAGCPYCSGKKANLETCLATIKPNVAKQWHSSKNESLTPYDVLPGSNKKAWWQCEKGHEWEAVIGSRNSGTGCPYCSGQKTNKENDYFLIG